MAGFTIRTAPCHSLHTREISTHTSRSARLRRSRFGGPLEDGELVAEGEDLRFKFGSSSETTANRRKEGDEARMPLHVISENAKLNRNKTYRVFGRDNRVNLPGK